MVIDLTKSVGPYVGVSRDKVLDFPEVGRSFRIVLYGAYNAHGLVGSECNGIAVLDEDQHLVVCDEIAKISSGYYGPDQGQIETFDRMCAMGWDEFKKFVNAHQSRLRHALGGPHPKLRAQDKRAGNRQIQAVVRNGNVSILIVQEGRVLPVLERAELDLDEACRFAIDILEACDAQPRASHGDDTPGKE